MPGINSADAQVVFDKCRKDPVFFCSEILGVELWEKQKQIIRSIAVNDNTIAASAHGCGKTFLAACAALWFLYCNKDSRVITTAPTYRQVVHILWAEIATLYRKARVSLGGELLKTSLTLSPSWFALGLSTDDPDKFQGQHAEHMLLIMDEAPGIEPPIYEAAQGILTSEHSKTLLIGNPTSPSGPFFDYFKNDRWTKFHISAYESPGITEPLKYPRLTSQKWIDDRLVEWGPTSPMFISRVLGQFPTEGEDTLIPLNWCDRALKRYEKDKKQCIVSEHYYYGLDVARYGSNKTCLVVYQPHRVIDIKTIQGKDLTETVNLVVQSAVSAGSKLIQVTTDDTGLGAGATDHLRALGYPVLPVNFTQRPMDQMHFRDIRSEMYWNLRELFRADEIAIPPNDALINQLSSIKYKIDPLKGYIQIETKDKMKERGLKSPDESDALAIAVHGCKRGSASKVFRRRTAPFRAADMAYY